MDNGSEFLKAGAITEFLLNKDLNVGQVTMYLLSNSVNLQDYPPPRIIEMWFSKLCAAFPFGLHRNIGEQWLYCQ